jgi:predicted dehydrogenase
MPRDAPEVIIAAAAIDDTPVRQAAEICRKRGRIVLVGVADLQLSRDLFYRKELTFQVSCSYGPGRYDPEYEEHGRDYPMPYVRWTAQRNFEAVLDMLSSSRLRVEPLITHRFPVAQATQAYAALENDSPLAIVLGYAPNSSQIDVQSPATEGAPERVLKLAENASQANARGDSIGVLGAGNYAARVLIPAFRDAGAHMQSLVTTTGVNGAIVGRRFGFVETATDAARITANPAIDNGVIATRHDSHSQYVRDALLAGKNVFVEKPLAINHAQLDEVVKTWESLPASNALLMVGFNRRFAPLTVAMKALTGTIAEPLVMVITVNAGDVPEDHWVQDTTVGGGRIVGEACHFIDYARFFAGCPVKTWQAACAGSRFGVKTRSDRATVTLEFENGSLATVHYIAGGHRAYPKERVEIFAGGRVLQLDNFRKLRGWGWQNFSNRRLWRQDKGNAACVTAFMQAVREGLAAPIPFAELVEVSRLSIDVADQLA